MNQRYPFYDLTPFTWATNLVSIVPGVLCVAGLLHGLWSWEALSVLSAEAPLSTLSVAIQERLATDTFIREMQVLSTLVLVLFYTYWVFYASRNMLALFEDDARSALRSLTLFFGLFARLHKITRLIDGMRFQSVPPGLDHDPAKWWLPVWSLSLLSANVCKLTAVYLMASAATVGDFRTVMMWAFAAFALYLIFYVVTARVTFEVVWLQRLSHEYQQENGR